MDRLIGRKSEVGILREAFRSGVPELVAVYGRRRVGKTFLVRQCLDKDLLIEFVGRKGASLKEQLKNMHQAVEETTGQQRLYAVPSNWGEAFSLLSNVIGQSARRRKVIFFDEFPWFNTARSGFLSAFDYWWNKWGTRRSDLMVIICGSSASWMIEHVVNNKAGLHNRLTRRIRLLPFNLKETEDFLMHRQIRLHRLQLMQLYMVMGGIPYYLKEIRKGESFSESIDRLCFTKDGLLNGEFSNLYASLFDHPDAHLAVVKALAGRHGGLNRKELLDASGFSSGGQFNQVMQELIESGFVSEWPAFQKKLKGAVFRLSDEFTYFYFRFMAGQKAVGKGTWSALAASPVWKSWSGFAFERLCFRHIDQIKDALGLTGVYTEASTWLHRDPDGTGTQIDLLLDRQDGVIHLVEIKFTTTAFTINKTYAAVLEQKLSLFKDNTRTNKSIFLTMITSAGMTSNVYSERLIAKSLTAEAIFR
jgi:uncharacterized protein